MLTSECLSPELIAIIARAVVLIVCSLAGTLSIYLGWRLYRDAVNSKTEGAAETSSLKVKFISAGPGVFFALFGMWLLVTLSNRTTEVSQHPNQPTSTQPFSLPTLKYTSNTQPCTPCKRILLFDGSVTTEKDTIEALNIAIINAAETAKLEPKSKPKNSTLTNSEIVNNLIKLKHSIESQNET